MNNLFYKFRLLGVFFFLIFFINRCKVNKSILLDEVKVSSQKKRLKYRASKTKYFNLIDTKLELEPIWSNKTLRGRATIKMTPYFYPQDSLSLDAKYMTIDSIKLIYKGESYFLSEYNYDSLKIKIQLPKSFDSEDTFDLVISYIANPEKIKNKYSTAIRSRKGLFFINHDGKDTNKMQQLWTQGETESASCWYPTFDTPNQKTTSTIALTVDKKFNTLSNGLLVNQIDKGNKRTDVWKMSLPHAPYLFMIAVGTFNIVKAKYKDVLLYYYIDDYYLPSVKSLFGSTAEILNFYSSLFQVEYPWEKYAQVVVHDFVSGAMENTTAVVHGEWIAKTKKELIDGNRESVIAHEAAHHWFGNLVTAESWSNITLNESFANYCEYLWNYYKYGKQTADYYIDINLSRYLRESKKKKVDLVRFNYNDEREMFDSHSYAKGGRILHMLRNYMGDKAFFKAINLYLTRYKFKATEVYQLRLVFEEIIGEDLNWFFNQWYYSKGHPELIINYKYDTVKKEQKIVVEQIQDTSQIPVYKLPVKISLNYGDSQIVKEVVVNATYNEFNFYSPKPPDFVNFELDKVLVCEKKDNHTLEEWWYMYKSKHSNFKDKKEALRGIYGINTTSDKFMEIIKDKFYGIRLVALQKMGDYVKNNKDKSKPLLLKILKEDSLPKIRALAAEKLSKEFKTDSLVIENLKQQLETDSSYNVISTLLNNLVVIDTNYVLTYTSNHPIIEWNSSLIEAYGRVFIISKTADKLNFYKQAIASTKKRYKNIHYNQLIEYVLTQEDFIKYKGIEYLTESIINNQKALLDLRDMYSNLFDIKDAVKDEKWSAKAKKNILKSMEKLENLELKKKLIRYFK